MFTMSTFVALITYQFPLDHWSQAMLSPVSTWMGDRPVATWYWKFGWWPPGIWIWMGTLGVVGNQVNVATTHSGVGCGMGRKGHSTWSLSSSGSLDPSMLTHVNWRKDLAVMERVLALGMSSDCGRWGCSSVVVCTFISGYYNTVYQRLD